MNDCLIALDQGTTSSRAIVFDAAGEVLSRAQYPFRQIYPRPGWVEHDPMEILATQLRALSEAFAGAGVGRGQIAGIGITNQRETAIVWERATGRPVYNAIVWQCRRTADEAERLEREGMGGYIREKTGLLPDPYFSGTKVKWILDSVPGARARAERGELLFGTVESWLIWNLTGRHITDCSNASRTMLFDIHRLAWDEALLRRLGIPAGMLPEPVSNAEVYGFVRPGLPGLEALAGVPVCGAAGDQQAALLGQGCVLPGQAKNTYGTGCFTLVNAGDTAPVSEGGLLTSVAWRLCGRTVYALEGSVFNAGSSIQWLRDELGIISEARECDTLAESVPDTGGVYLVSAFTGLGAPWWDARARGVILGLTRGTGRAQLCRAALEGIAFQVADLLAAMEKDTGRRLEVLRVDGGASVSDLLMQIQADLLRRPVDRPRTVETTALGAAFLAGLAAGLYTEPSQVNALRRPDRVFTPGHDEVWAAEQMRGWHLAVERALHWER